ncbi:MAG: Nudix family hydrolase [Marinobacter sp.]|uniref:Nudix family hydrolase n=1 Tax=Marinobacter sp. TaxID=50741 RepID=UPI0034A0A8C3
MLTTGPEFSQWVHVAVAVIRRQNRVLVARRPDYVHQGGLLEFPGGKVEAGESVQRALIREIAEETGLEVPEYSLKPLIGIGHDYGDKRVFLDVWSTECVIGEPEGREGQEVNWRTVEGLLDEDFPAGNRPIIRALKLPDRYCISGAFDDISAGLERLERQLRAHRPAMVLLRAPWLTGNDYAELARGASRLCQRFSAPLLLHGRVDLLDEVSAAGIHVTWEQARSLSRRPVPGHRWFAVSCHSEYEIAQASQLEADFITLGPVMPTLSHPGAATLGWLRFQELVKAANVPVFALGGMVDHDLETARIRGAQGIAGIGNWW